MTLPESRIDVAVVGAGIIGVCTALELAERGMKVTIFDPAPVCSKTSYGNAGVISPWTCVPQSMPGLWKQVPGWLIDPDGPVSIRPGYLPKLLPWVLRFIAAGRPERLDPVADALFRLSKGSVEAYKKRLSGTGKEQLVQDSLYVHVYRNRNSASLDHLGWQLRRSRQVPVELIDKVSLKEIEPDISDDYEAAILIKQQGRTNDPAGVGVALAEKALAKGASHIQAKVQKIYPDNGAGCKLVTDQGEFRAKKIVLAAGIWSCELLKSFGLKLPLEAERGYHLVLRNPGITINNSVMDAEQKYVASLMAAGVRVAGTAEFAGLDAAPNYARAKRFANQAKKLFPQLNCEEPDEWMGSRPSFPDSLPCLGEIPGVRNIIAAFGHSHYGLGMAPGTSEIVADYVTQRITGDSISPYSIMRFQ
ncbi:FAD-binding oxidoreductase [Candidatus Puniceispirillum sp.]|jgi:D-amino-acid dehydrogenase|nr:FAD-binding oxidoreductase [Candidatus Puniceispirillum sp.]